MLMSVPVILDQVVDYCFHYVGSKFWLLFPLFWIRLLVTVSIFLSVCWSLFLLFWIRMLMTVPVILDQVVDYCSHYVGSKC
jgi:hypothetical protein